MNTEDHRQPEALPSGQVYRITPQTPPVFPCWLWDVQLFFWWRATGYPNGMTLSDYNSYWHPDSPTAPTARPMEDAPLKFGGYVPEACKGKDAPSPEVQPWMVAAAKEMTAHTYKGVYVSGQDEDEYTFMVRHKATIIARHAPPAPATGETLLQLAEQLADAVVFSPAMAKPRNERVTVILSGLASFVPATSEELRPFTAQDVDNAKKGGNALYKNIVGRLESYFPKGSRDLEWDVLPDTLEAEFSRFAFLSTRQSGEVEALKAEVEKKHKLCADFYRDMESALGDDRTKSHAIVADIRKVINQRETLRAEITRLTKLLEEKAT